MVVGPAAREHHGNIIRKWLLAIGMSSFSRITHEGIRG